MSGRVLCDLIMNTVAFGNGLYGQVEKSFLGYASIFGFVV